MKKGEKMCSGAIAYNDARVSSSGVAGPGGIIHSGATAYNDAKVYSSAIAY